MCEGGMCLVFTADCDDGSSTELAGGVTGQVVSLWTGVVVAFENGTVGEDDWA